ncbi:hypothetical protein P7C73_g4623, partial [Tremellales sp. Uapishka_1]
MAQPAKPPTLLPDHTYIHVSSSSSPPALAEKLTTTQPIQVRYIGPVGELKGEHIFELVGESQTPLKRDSTFWTREGESLLRDLKRVEGVKKVEVMEVRQRAKRGEL